MIAYTLTPTSITVVVDFTPKVIPSSHPNFKRIVELVANPATTEAQIAPLLDIPAAITNFTGGQVTVIGGKLFYNGYEVRTSLAKTIMGFINQGNDALSAPLIRFLENVMQNPDPRAAQDLFDWVQASGLPLTGDGCVLAWKAVRGDYFSIHSPNDKRFDHHIGNFLSMPRHECDANPLQTCSRGLHFCSADYLKSYGGGGSRVVVVKIHPKDVVAFPKDYGNAKGRACAYQVVGEVPLDQVKTFYPQGTMVYTGFDRVGQKTATVAPLSSCKVEAGNTYRRRDGREVQCTGVSGRGQYAVASFKGGFANVYASTGRANIDRESSTDVVSFVGKTDNRIPIRVIEGRRYRLRSGAEVTVTNVAGSGSNRVAYFSNGSAVFADNGFGNKVSETQADVMADLGPATVRVGRFAVGQTWRTRNGQTVKIVSTDDPRGRPDFPIGGDNGATFTTSGCYYKDRSSPADLVTLVSDVA